MGTANIGKRIVAYLIDSFIIGIAGYILLNFIAVDYNGLYLMLFIIGFAYGGGFEASQKQATPGKMVMKLQVAGGYGVRSDTGKIMIRNLIKYSPYLLMLILPEYVCGLLLMVNFGTALFAKTRQTLHDMAADPCAGRGLSPGIRRAAGICPAPAGAGRPGG